MSIFATPKHTPYKLSVFALQYESIEKVQKYKPHLTLEESGRKSITSISVFESDFSYRSKDLDTHEDKGLSV